MPFLFLELILMDYLCVENVTEKALRHCALPKGSEGYSFILVTIILNVHAVSIIN